MDGNKISRRYILDKFFERTNKKVTLQNIISRVVKENQRKYGHTKTLSYNTIQLFARVLRFVGRNISIRIISIEILQRGMMVMRNITILY